MGLKLGSSRLPILKVHANPWEIWILLFFPTLEKGRNNQFQRVQEHEKQIKNDREIYDWLNIDMKRGKKIMKI